MSATIYAGGDPSKVDVGGYSKGEILAADASGDLAALPIDITGKVLTLDSVAALGVDWQAGGGGGGGVNSVFGRVGNVVAQTGDYTKTQVGLGNVDNTSDANKPVSTAQQTALNLKANLASPTFTGTATFAKSVNTPVALTDAATIATNASLGNTFRVTLGGNRTLGAPTNPTDGQMAIWEITQGSGGQTLALASGAGGFLFGTDITSITLSTGAGVTDLLGCRYNLSDDRWWVIAFLKGF